MFATCQVPGIKCHVILAAVGGLKAVIVKEGLKVSKGHFRRRFWHASRGIF